MSLAQLKQGGQQGAGRHEARPQTQQRYDPDPVESGMVSGHEAGEANHRRQSRGEQCHSRRAQHQAQGTYPGFPVPMKDVDGVVDAHADDRGEGDDVVDVDLEIEHVHKPCDPCQGGQKRRQHEGDTEHAAQIDQQDDAAHKKRQSDGLNGIVEHQFEHFGKDDVGARGVIGVAVGSLDHLDLVGEGDSVAAVSQRHGGVDLHETQDLPFLA